MRTHGQILVAAIIVCSLTPSSAEAQSVDQDVADKNSIVAAVDLGNSITVRGPLGVLLGDVIDIVATYDKNSDKVSQLLVESVNGKPLPDSVAIAYQWARPADKTDLRAAKKILLRGYQTGRFIGTPTTDVLAATPRQQLTFQSSFIIVQSLNIASPAQNLQIAELINQLALEEDDIFFEEGGRFVKRESSDRIDKSVAELSELGRAAWPVLLESVSDRRPCIAVQPTNGGHTVGVMCLDIIRRQIINVPEGYPSSKSRLGKDGNSHQSPRLTWGFHPSLKQWLKIRRDDSLNKIHADVLEQLIREEDNIGYQAPESKVKIHDQLTAHLNDLKQFTKNDIQK